MSSAGLEKANLIRLDALGHPVESIKVAFNPKELTISKTNSWKQAKKPKANIPEADFEGGSPATLKLQLFFDTYKEGKDVQKEYTDNIYKLMYVDPALRDKKSGKSRPPSVIFQWGKMVSFEGVITSISQRFTLFLPQSATPVRALLDLTIQQVKDPIFYPKQNPTSGGEGGERVWTVKAGDTLQWIAYVEYNNPTEWRRIADANGLYHVRRLTPGMTLSIPNA
jgi:nucleoid-associated protein YgaU